jgi:hypothetical protein
MFEDHDGLEAIRKEHSAAHFDYLAANRDGMVVAGGLRPAPGAWNSGS